MGSDEPLSFSVLLTKPLDLAPPGLVVGAIMCMTASTHKPFGIQMESCRHLLSQTLQSPTNLALSALIGIGSAGI